MGNGYTGGIVAIGGVHNLQEDAKRINNLHIVAPLKTFAPDDVKKSANNIDLWLSQIHPSLSVQKLAGYAGVIPVVGNIIALIDTIELIINLVDNENPDVLDWVDLCINLIGVIPVPPNLAAARMTLRPMVMEAKNAIKSGKKTLTESVQQVLRSGLNEKIAGELNTFIEGAESILDNLVNSCAEYSTKLSNDFGQGLINLANGKINSTAQANTATDQKNSFSKVTKANFIRDPNKTIRNFFKGISETLTTSLASAVGLLLSDEAKKFLINMGEKIKKLGAKAATMIKNNAKKYLKQFLDLIKTIIGSKKKSGATKPNTTTTVKNTNPAGEIEGKTKLAKPTANPNPCNCGGASATKKSISFALGTEFLMHHDADIIAPQDIHQIRSYASNLHYYDKSEFGARWLTPWTSKIFVEGDQFIYVDETGRMIQLPKLATNTTYFAVSENLYITNLDTELVIEYKNKDQYLFEKYKDHYVLKAIVKANKSSIVLGHDDGILRKISFFQNEKLNFFITCQINEQKKVVALTLHQDGQQQIISQYHYNQTGDLVQAITRDLASYHYEYHQHLITRYTDLTNRAMNLEWDSEACDARAIHEWADDGSQELFLHWLDDKRCTITMDAEGNTTSYFYDIKGYNYRIIYPDGQEEWFFRDDNSKVTQHFTPSGEVYIYHYNDKGELLESIHPDGSFMEYQYQEGNPVQIKNAMGALWTNEYDAQDQLIKEIDPLGRETLYQYNEMGLPIKITDAKGGSRIFNYDVQGQLLSYQDCSGKETRWSYDHRGRISCVENALQQKVEYFYNDLSNKDRSPVLKDLPLNAQGQLEKIKHADGLEEHFIHDAEGRLLIHVDQNQQVTKYQYNDAGLISLRTDALGHTLKYEWDKLGRLKRLINENGASFSFEYDEVGRLLKEVDFDGKETIYQYDKATKELRTSIEIASIYGQSQQSHHTVKDRVQHFVFDSMGRLEQRTAGFGRADELQNKKIEEFSYDGNGQLILAKNDTHAVHLFYDAVGNQIREHQQDLITEKTAVWQYEYDELDHKVKTIRPDGQTVEWLTYGSGHIHGMTLNGQDTVSFERDDLHREVVRHYANGLSQEQQYDVNGRLNNQILFRGHKNAYSAKSEQNNAIQETHQLIQRLYKYDKSSQLTQINDSRRGNIVYKYDPVGRLLESTSKLGRETFSFDPANNIIDTDHNTHAMSIQKEYKGHRAYHLVNNIVQDYLDQQYQYDAYGQLIKQKSNQGDLTLEWDTFGRLIQSENNQYRAEYRYDALGRRIEKISQHKHSGKIQQTIYGWEGDTVAFESNDMATKHYIYEKDSFIPLIQATYNEQINLHKTPEWRKIYVYRQDPLWHKTNKSKPIEQIGFYHCDHLGTPQEISDGTGTIIWKAQYKAWGDCQVEAGKSNFFENSEIITNHIRFQGQYFDEETGLHYNRYRYYSPYVGRFISKDPIGLLGGNNIYAYAPNPVGLVDPLGLLVTPVYTRGANGRVERVQATITKNDLNSGTSTNASSIAEARRMGNCNKVQAGHLLAKRLGGSGGVGHVFPQTPGINMGTYRVYEGKIAKDVDVNGSAKVDIKFMYPNTTSKMPNGIIYTYESGGESHSQVFANPSPCK